MPWRLTGRGLLHHILDRRLVLLPTGAIAEILVGQLPALQRVGEPAAKPAQLFVGGDVHEQLDEPRVVGDQYALEVVDLVVGPAPFVGRGEALYALDQDAAVPGAVENDDLAVLWQALPKALEVMQRLLTLGRSGDRMHLEATRVERPARAANNAALARSVPTLENDHSPLGRPEVGLLNALKRFLEFLKTALIVGELDLRETLNFGKSRTFGNNKVGGLHERQSLPSQQSSKR